MAERLADIIDRVQTILATGRFLAAHDEAISGLQQYPSDPALSYNAVLAIARAGATERAMELYRELDLPGLPVEDPKLKLDIGALWGRLHKDLGLQTRGEAARDHFQASADAYWEVFRQTGDAYPAINAAALYCWIGEMEKAEDLASRCVSACEGMTDYYSLATLAEAYLILRCPARATAALARAADLGAGRAEMATTRRQLKKTCQVLGLDEDLLSPLTRGPIVRYLGHMPWPDLDGPAEALLKQRIGDFVTQKKVETAYGALAAGVDILAAEVMLAAGVELHVILPLDVDEFLAASVLPFGGLWRERFEACLAAAKSVAFSASGGQPADGASFRYCSAFTRGVAALQAQATDAELHQLAVWNGTPVRKPGGTLDDILIWQGRSRPQTILTTKGDPVRPGDLPNVPPIAGDADREIRAVLFADFAGFSKLKEADIGPFLSRSLAVVADVAARHEAGILCRNTWGDGIFLVLDTVETAARLARDILDALSGPGEAEAGRLPIRIGLHVAPMSRIADPLTGRTTYVGAEISKASRIEPIVPANSIYATEACAGALALSGDRTVQSEYMGMVELAKSAGMMPIFRLKAVAG
ncbi:adenylate/guanylate cyclase domain-containing protein [uncultured Roseibium sp.]|uniref:adenylate/guanylate cyclase domain-containing protein n=1 Tax=uncultured Roseibium sp. TaxID=1936171 RepID=UPI003216380D